MMRMTAKKKKSGTIMDRTVAVPKKQVQREQTDACAPKGAGFSTRLQASSSALSGNICKGFCHSALIPLLWAQLVIKLGCYLPFMSLIKNQIYMPKLTVVALLITHKYN